MEAVVLKLSFKFKIFYLGAIRRRKESTESCKSQNACQNLMILKQATLMWTIIVLGFLKV